MDMHGHELAQSSHFGVAVGAMSMAIPDGVMSFVGKVGVALMVAFISTTAHALVKAFWKKVFK